MHRLGMLVFVTVMLLQGGTSHAEQLYKPELKVPNATALSSARKMCTELFENLKNGKTTEIADWIITQLGYTDTDAEKLRKKNDFKSKLDLILAGPPANAYGKLDGYELIDEGYLPGSVRYFRFVYISYHQKAPLLWEFRFYVMPDGQLSVNYVGWSEKNPFEYMATAEMRLPSWAN